MVSPKTCCGSLLSMKQPKPRNEVSPPVEMSAEDFRRVAMLIVGSESGWQTRIAQYLGVHTASVSRYATGRVKVPAPTAKLLLRESASSDHGA